jgi:LAS superfamily LD-carboxypeptidase LdcB
VISEQLTGKDGTQLVELEIGTKSFLVHDDVRQDLAALVQAAHLAGFRLFVASGYRSFEQQLNIWNSKMLGHRAVLDEQSQGLDINSLSEEERVLAILKWSALPGASRHHWGTDFDVYAGNLLPQNTVLRLEPWEYLGGHQDEFYQWLKENIGRYGFFFPYTENGSGVAFEPWHISHKACATRHLKALTLQTLSAFIEQSPILGRETVLSKLEYIYNTYINTAFTRG